MNSKKILFIYWLVGFSLIIGCKSNNYLAALEANRLDVSAENHLEEDPEIQSLIAPYKSELDAVMAQVIGFTTEDLEKKRPESNLGNWMADAIHRKAEKYAEEEIDFAVQNYGGIRLPIIKKGDITRRKIYELMPFDNIISILYLEKEIVEELINHLVESNGWPVSSSLKIQQLSETKTSILINDKPLNETEVYKVALPDYIANGGSRCDFLKGKKRNDLSILIRDALIEDVIDFAKNNQAIPAKIEQRFVTINE